MPYTAPASSVSVSAAPLTLYHRGFAVSLHRAPGGTGGYGFEIRHERLVLHASDGSYGSAPRAERAARRFVDDALGAFERAHAHLDADA